MFLVTSQAAGLSLRLTSVLPCQGELDSGSYVCVTLPTLFTADWPEMTT